MRRAVLPGNPVRLSYLAMTEGAAGIKCQKRSFLQAKREGSSAARGGIKDAYEDCRIYSRFRFNHRGEREKNVCFHR